MSNQTQTLKRAAPLLTNRQMPKPYKSDSPLLSNFLGSAYVCKLCSSGRPAMFCIKCSSCTFSFQASSSSFWISDYIVDVIVSVEQMLSLYRMTRTCQEGCTSWGALVGAAHCKYCSNWWQIFPGAPLVANITSFWNYCTSGESLLSPTVQLHWKTGHNYKHVRLPPGV